MKKNLTLAVMGGILVAVIVGLNAIFIVHQTQQAIVLQFGDPKRVIVDPGLKFKVPFVQDVIYYDNRLLDFPHSAEEVIAADQKRLVVDSFARWQIIDALRFYETVGNERGARARLNSFMSAGLRRVIGGVPLAAVLTEKRADIRKKIRAEVDGEAKDLGIRVFDVRIRRADLPAENSQAIYARMKSERDREAKEFRAQGAEIAQRIRARADRDRVVLIAESKKKAQILRGEGDAESIRIYADAFGTAPDFYSFYRSLQAYRQFMQGDNTTLVLSPDSAFFKFFKDPGESKARGK
jgi:membrane protease subunit HflC